MEFAACWSCRGTADPLAHLHTPMTSTEPRRLMMWQPVQIMRIVHGILTHEAMEEERNIGMFEKLATKMAKKTNCFFCDKKEESSKYTSSSQQ
ncbi:hypothetical protein EGR_11284 [Echinococcus granulosus]|uniref:Uncharacterized protein n=1 Tax=Echinococcus granulosus TaxID=6210 RepID=W6TYJ4_ECHGR|nr:hypothetical protein EGR_11284 [Echinococcus granulosus]EUB53865.1 hypothetical protein EGR_11284 [Echinococcus granulosus]